MTTTPAPTLVTFSDAQNVLGAALPTYRRRPQQEMLAAAIEAVLASTDGHLLAQAGTGTGKSIAALLPAILSGKRVVLTTTTIALMNQYVRKDLPLLEEHLEIPFTWAPLKGLNNFLCKAKLNQSPKVELLADVLEEINTPEGSPAHTGDRDDIETPVTQAEWRELSSTSDECPGRKKCPLAESCYGLVHRDNAINSQIVVTNTAMFFTDLKLNRDARLTMDVPADTHPVIGPYDVLIADEAHELIDQATEHLGHHFSQGAMLTFVEQSVSFLGTHTDFDAEPLADKVTGLMRDLLRIFTEHLGREPQVSIDENFIEQHFPLFEQLLVGLDQFISKIVAVKADRGVKKDQADRKQHLEATGTQLLSSLKLILLSDDDEAARWVETYTLNGSRGQKITRWLLKNAPIDVSRILKSELWDKVPAVLMSATLATGTGASKFGYIAKSLGLPPSTGTLDVGTPFDYARQARLFYPPASVPSPAPASRAKWATWVPEATLQLVRAAGGGAMLLYTSRTAMTAAHAAIGQRLRQDGITTFMQGGSMTNKEIADRFRADEDSVLFGLRSFMTGMDFPGRTARLVVLDKLPFPVPSVPIFAARERAVKKRGGEPFTELSVPMMTLILEQAFGRLIRSVDDWGMVAILDSRLASKPYGRRIRTALPPAPEMTDLDAVKPFFDQWNGTLLA